MTTDWWERRKRFKYYTVVRNFAKKYAPGARDLLDVGGYQPGYLKEFDWIPTKACVDVDPKSVEGVEMIKDDFLRYKLEKTVDVVLCLQVLEHIVDPVPFARKLLEAGAVTIVSVPYGWPAGSCEGHLHDPVDGIKLEAWMNKAPRESLVVVDEGAARLVAVYVRSDG